MTTEPAIKALSSDETDNAESACGIVVHGLPLDWRASSSVVLTQEGMRLLP